MQVSHRYPKTSALRETAGRRGAGTLMTDGCKTFARKAPGGP